MSITHKTLKITALTISCYGRLTTVTIELPVRQVTFIHQCDLQSHR